MDPAGQPQRLAPAATKLNSFSGGALLLEAPGVATALLRTLIPNDFVALRSAGRAGRRAANAAIEEMGVHVDSSLPKSWSASPDDAALFGTTGGAPFAGLRRLRVSGDVRPAALAKLLTALPDAAPSLKNLDLRAVKLEAAAPAGRKPAAAASARVTETPDQALARAGGELRVRVAARAALAPLLAPLARTLESLKLDRVWLAAPAATALAVALEGGSSSNAAGPQLSLKGELTPAALEELDPRLLRRLRKLSVVSVRGCLKILSYGNDRMATEIAEACLGGEPTEDSPPSALAALLGGATSLRSLTLAVALSAAQLRAIGESGSGGRLRTLRVAVERYSSYTPLTGTPKRPENLAPSLAAFPRLRRVRLHSMLPSDHYGNREPTTAAFPVADVLAALPQLERLEAPSIEEGGSAAGVAALLALAPPASLSEVEVLYEETDFKGGSAAVLQSALAAVGGAPDWAASLRRLRVGETTDEILPLLALATGLTHLSLTGRSCNNHSDWCVRGVVAATAAGMCELIPLSSLLGICAPNHCH
jgi:hypothetical protein